MSTELWRTHNPGGSKRVVVTKELPGNRWLQLLEAADCRLDICTSDQICSVADIAGAIGDRCDGAIGQLTERWTTAIRSTEGPGRYRRTATTRWVSTTSRCPRDSRGAAGGQHARRDHRDDGRNGRGPYLRQPAAASWSRNSSCARGSTRAVLPTCSGKLSAAGGRRDRSGSDCGPPTRGDGRGTTR